MAEICLDCWNKLNESNDPARKYVLSWTLDLCGDCGQMKRVVVRTRLPYIYLENARELAENIRRAIRNPRK